MPAEVSHVALLGQLRHLRRSGRRLSASIITTYSIHLPFYEDVVLRELEAVGSRFNVVLVDAAALGQALAAGSSRPRRAGADYLLVPVRCGGAFHPKIIALFSDKGMAIAVGSHNLTESGFGRNGEITITYGIGRETAPASIAGAVAEYVLQCAGELAPGDPALSRRLADRLRSLAKRGNGAEDGSMFLGGSPGAPSLLDRAFTGNELAAARRILILGPYFDSALRFLAEIRSRAPKAQLIVAIQPDHAVMKHPERIPKRTRLCNANALALRDTQPFIHAKAIVVETDATMTVAIGSANPSAPAWTADIDHGNYEAIVGLRGKEARKTVQALGLERLWTAPELSKDDLRQMAARSKTADEREGYDGALPVVGVWREGRVEAPLAQPLSTIVSIKQFLGTEATDLALVGAVIEGEILRFPATQPGVFAVAMRREARPRMVIAVSPSAFGAALSSGPAARLIDSLDQLQNGAAPGDELLDLCERVLLEPDDGGEDADDPARARGRRTAEDGPADHEPQGPRGISIAAVKDRTRQGVALDLDISAVITLLLKELEGAPKDRVDPNIDESDEILDPVEPDEEATLAKHHWEDIVAAVRPRVRRLLNRLKARIGEKHSPKWKYERVLVTLALLKRLRKFHPSDAIPISGAPERLVADAQLRDAFKLAMRCFFARQEGILGALGRLGGLDAEHEVVGRALLLWAAYEAGVDFMPLKVTRSEAHDVRSMQADRMDALIAAIAAAASPAALDRAHRELRDRGLWNDAQDRSKAIEAWFDRHARLGRAFQMALSQGRPPLLPVTNQSPTMHDLVVWKQEPGWPRLPQAIVGRAIHLTDVGNAAPVKLSREFVSAINLEALGLVAPLR